MFSIDFFRFADVFYFTGLGLEYRLFVVVFDVMIVFSHGIGGDCCQVLSGFEQRTEIGSTLVRHY